MGLLYKLYVLGIRSLAKPFYTYFTRLPNHSPLKDYLIDYSRRSFHRANEVEIKYMKQKYHFGYLRESEKMLCRDEALEFLAEMIVELSLYTLGIVGIVWYINNLFKDHHQIHYQRISVIQEKINQLKQIIDVDETDLIEK